MRALTLVLSIATIIALASCGVGGGNAAAGGGPSSSSSPAASATIGERVLPGYLLSASHLTEIQAGQPCTVRVTVTPEAGQAAVASLEVWLGTSAYDATATTTAATPVSGETGIYDVTVDLPATLAADATVWIRLTATDGTVLEAGRDAFPLAAR